MRRRKIHTGILVATPEGKRPLTRSIHKRDDNIKMDLREIVWRLIDWTQLYQDTDNWWALVNTAMNFKF
jgi:hypothetical protein